MRQSPELINYYSDTMGVCGTYEVLHCRLTRLVDAFHVFEDVVRIGIDDRYADVPVILILQGPD